MTIVFQHEDDENGVTAIDLAHALIRTGLDVDILSETSDHLRIYAEYEKTAQRKREMDLEHELNVIRQKQLERIEK